MSIARKLAGCAYKVQRTFNESDSQQTMKSSCSPQPKALEELYLDDPEFACAHVSHDLIDFAAGRNTVCRSSSMRRCNSDSRLLFTQASPAPLPPPRPFRRSGASNRRSSSARNEDSALATARNGISARSPAQELSLENGFDDDLFMFLFTAEAVH